MQVGKMDAKEEVAKMVVGDVNLDEMKHDSTFLLASPRVRRRLQKQSSAKLNCLCSPTTHTGSFRCRHHRNSGLLRNSGSVGSNLSELAAKTADINEAQVAQYTSINNWNEKALAASKQPNLNL